MGSCAAVDTDEISFPPLVSKEIVYIGFQPA